MNARDFSFRLILGIWASWFLGASLHLASAGETGLGPNSAGQGQTNVAPSSGPTRLADEDQVWLRQGQRLTGRLRPQTISLRTAYGALRLDTAKLAGIQFAVEPGGLDTVSATNRDRFSGFVENPEFRLDPASGEPAALRREKLLRVLFRIRAAEAAPSPKHPRVRLRNGDVLTGTGDVLTSMISADQWQAVFASLRQKLEPHEVESIAFLEGLQPTAKVQPLQGGAVTAKWPAEDFDLELDVGGKLRVYWGLIDRVDFQDRSSNTADGSGAGDTSSPVEGRSFRGMVWIPAGQFTMGSPLEEAGRDLDEGPQTVVTLTRGFWIGAREITQAEYTAVMRSNPSAFAGNPQFPVEKVTWRDAKDYCERLTQLQEKAGALPPGYAYRLPTEAEWEYACRAGSHTRFSYGEDPEVRRLPDYAWYGDNCDSSPHPVGLKQPNPWGLYDMHGNVLEWCLDAATSSLPGGTVTNHQAPEDSSLRIARGGSWLYGPKSCRAANRDSYGEFTRCSDLGFRVVLAPVQR